MPFKPLNPHTLTAIVTIQPPGSTCSSTHLSLSRPPVSSSLKFCNRPLIYAAPTLWNGLPKDLRQFAHPPISPLNSTSPPLALSSSAFHSRLKTELFKISYPDSTPAPHTTTIITDCHRSTMLSPRLNLPDFDLAPKRTEEFGYCGFDLI